MICQISYLFLLVSKCKTFPFLSGRLPGAAIFPSRHHGRVGTALLPASKRDARRVDTNRISPPSSPYSAVCLSTYFVVLRASGALQKPSSLCHTPPYHHLFAGTGSLLKLVLPVCAKDDPELWILLPLLPERWGCRCVPPHPAPCNNI